MSPWLFRPLSNTSYDEWSRNGTLGGATLSWLTHSGFKEFVEQKWSQEGSLVQKLGELAQNLKQWNKEVFSYIFQCKNKLRARIAGVQYRDN